MWAFLTGQPVLALYIVPTLECQALIKSPRNVVRGGLREEQSGGDEAMGSPDLPEAFRAFPISLFSQED